MVPVKQGPAGNEAWLSRLVRPVYCDQGTRRTYSAAFPGNTQTTEATGTVSPSTHDMASIYKPASSGKLMRVQRVVISLSGGVAGRIRVRLRPITLDGNTGTALCVAMAHDPNDPAPDAIVRMGPVNTYGTGEGMQWVMAGADSRTFEWSVGSHPEAKPLLMRPGVAEGWGVSTSNDVALTTTSNCMVFWTWTEE